MSGSDLDDQRAFLLDSIEDLERERAAGDLAEDDYVALRATYTRRAAAVLRALEDTGGPGTDRTPPLPPEPTTADAPPAPGPHGRRRPARKRQRLVVGATVMAVAVVAFVLVATQTANRLPGQTASGTVDLSKAAQIRRTVAQAETLQQDGDGAGALQLYRQVLAEDPTQVDALAQSGWLEFEAGVQAKNTSVLDNAESLEQAAARAQPSAYAPHLYLGSMYLAAGDDGDAVDQYRQFLADHPPQSQVVTAKAFIEQAYDGAGVALPSLPSG